MAPVTCDLIGKELDEVHAQLARAGVEVGSVHETQSPRPRALAGPLRVVRVRGDPAGPLELVVTRERYVPPLTPQ